MPSLLPSTENVAISGVCLFRVARLDSDCTILGGNGSGYVTAGIGDFTASPNVTEGVEISPTNGCGQTMYTIARPDRITRYDVSGNLIFFDPEAWFQMFGGTLILGNASGDFNGDAIGWASPSGDQVNNGVYLEVISQTVGEGAGDCVVGGSGRPAYIGHIFPKARLIPGDISLTDGDAIFTAFTGKATANPNGFNGPWNDYPGQGTLPTTPYAWVGYSTDEYEAILADVAAGAADLPVGS